MEISFTGPAFTYLDRLVGYGEAAHNILGSLKKAGLNVTINSPTADVEVCFNLPGKYQFFNKDSYKIGYTAWESTDVTPQARKVMNQVDELWATSDWVADAYRNLFPQKKIFVYKHGIDHSWLPEKRKKAGDPFTFLHVGEPYSRKDGQMATDAFIELFRNDPKYRLVLKCSGINTIKVADPKYGYLSSPSAAYDNIVTIESFLDDAQFKGLHGLCDVFLYPTWGEGFGFQPLQALASGMPVITTEGWSDYAEYITWPVSATWSSSPWPETHQGYMMKPNKEHLKDRMLQAVGEYESVLDKTFKNAFKLHEKYDWDTVSESAVDHIKEIFASLHSR
jgi:glycosyltransferase involved in cell wall biosynthesis